MNDLDGNTLSNSNKSVLDELSALIWGTSLFGGQITGALNSGILGELSLAQLSHLFIIWRNATFLPQNSRVRLVFIEALIKGIILALHPNQFQQTDLFSASTALKGSEYSQIQAWLKRRVTALRQEAFGTHESKCWLKNITQSPMLCGSAEEIFNLDIRTRSHQLQDLKKQIEAELYIDALPEQIRNIFRSDWLPCISLILSETLHKNKLFVDFLKDETENFAAFQWDVISTIEDIQNVVHQIKKLLHHPQNYLSFIQIVDFDTEALYQELQKIDNKDSGLSNLIKDVSQSNNQRISLTDTKVEKVLELLENSQEIEDSTSKQKKIEEDLTNPPNFSPSRYNPERKRVPVASVVLTGLPVTRGESSLNAMRPIWRCINTLSGHSDSVVSVAFGQQNSDPELRSPYLVVSGSWDKSINIWQLKNLEQSQELPNSITDNSASIYSVAISPDRQFLATGCANSTVRLWHLPTNRRLHILTGHSVPIYSVAFSPNGEILASGSGDQTIKLWQVSTGELLGTLIGHSSFVYSVTFSPDGELLVSGSTDKTIKIWQLKTQQLVRTLIGNSPVTSVSLSPNSHILASASRDETIKLWQIQGSPSEGGTRAAPTRTLRGHTAEVLCVAISPRAPVLASGSHDKTIKLWHLETGELMGTLTGHFDSVNAVAFSSDGHFLASGSHDKTVKIWRHFY
ncbi:WD40 repeat-containing protein [Oscillatoria acuminata PCC 6304]|uniref:WD40 repeat-containing protein n=2 Tax=Oscillatoria acuminata TaxID=118323 RepID=K9TF29_9CYAN|nr:WD40 repeat-containing protein [Oscillatoria acuminata PCC 6304]